MAINFPLELQDFIADQEQLIGRRPLSSGERDIAGLAVQYINECYYAGRDVPGDYPLGEHLDFDKLVKNGILHDPITEQEQRFFMALARWCNTAWVQGRHDAGKSVETRS